MDKDLTDKDKYSFSKHYQSGEFPSNYRTFLVESYTVQELFVSECLHKIYSSGRLSGTRLLDFGSGPTVHRIASASRQFDEIILSEWSEENRKEAGKWLHGDKDALDWTPLLEQCARAEGYRDIKFGVAEIETRIRKAVKKIVPCDALSDNIFPEDLGEFDVISSSYCLEGCSTNIEIYKTALKKIVKYLKKGGALVMAAVLKAEYYNVHQSLPTLYLTESTIKEGLIEAGLEIKDWFSWIDTKKHENFAYEGTAVYYAVKH